MRVHPEREAAFERLTQDLDPYHEFLRFDHVIAEVEDPQAWRAEIRRQARRDKIAMRSFIVGRTAAGLWRVWAGKQQTYDVERMRQLMERGAAQSEAADRATLRGHSIHEWLRARDAEAAARCSRCGARLYVDVSAEPPIVSGEVFETDCN